MRAPAILIVEDERIVGMDLQVTLAEMGFDPFAVVSTCQAALAAVARRKPDLVLMDVRLRGPMSGIDCAVDLRERFGVPVVFLTAHCDESTRSAAERARPVGFLAKPLRYTDLRDAIERSLAGSTA